MTSMIELQTGDPGRFETVSNSSSEFQPPDSKAEIEQFEERSEGHGELVCLFEELTQEGT